MNDEKKACKMLLKSAIEAGKLQNRFMRGINSAGRSRMALKGDNELFEEVTGESIAHLGDAAIKMKNAQFNFLRVYNDTGCNDIVGRDWEQRRVKEIKGIETQRNKILGKMEDLASRAAMRFK